jgi:hypothetical protein
LITNIPGIISNDHPEIVSFVENMGKVNSIIYSQYVPDWYFAGEIMWERNQDNESIISCYDELTKSILGIDNE